MTLPTVARPQQGIFVYRRLQAMSRYLAVRALRPQPWFPGIRTGKLDLPIASSGFPMDPRRMLYLPGVAKSLDGRWMARCVERWFDALQIGSSRPVLDAHFAYPEGVACHRVARKKGLPFFITLRGVEQDWFLQPRVRDQIVRALNEASGVIAVSESLRTAAATAGVNPDRIHVIPNGCDTTIFHPGSKQAARGSLGLKSDKKLIVCVANIKRVKGHDILISALARLKRSTDFELVCIGDVDQFDFAHQVQRLIQRYALVENVRFTGSLAAKEIAEYLRAADVFVLASRREGCCNAILEAMACGTPVVATEVGDHTALAQHFAGIQLAPSEDPNGICEAILTMLQHGDQAPCCGRRRFEPKSWAEVAIECVNVMRQTGSLDISSMNTESSPV
jgi:teichuronic acid biosynthesis glycosyltransferase TuaC